jgi:plastocyanin
MKKRHFLTGFLMIMAIGFLFLACKKNNANTSNGGTVTVSMKNSMFSNADLRVMTGTKVVWHNDDSVVHTVTADNNSFDSGDIPQGGSYSFMFNSAGTFAYHDKHNASMTGVVVVTGGQSTY